MGLHKTDSLSVTHNLVDTDALYSVYPTLLSEHSYIDIVNVCLAAENGSLITTYGIK